MKEGKTLVICVDRDDDLGEKTGIRGPVLGRKENLKAAEKLILSDPEEADANTMFAAVKIYDELRDEGREAEIVTLTGHPRRGLKADEEIRRQIEKVLENVKVSEAILVSDGGDDEYVIPIIQSYIPRLMLHRVIVQQSEQIETTYILLKRYIEKMLKEKSTRRWILGVPGLFLLITAILTVLNKQQFISIGIMGVVGAILLIKGFELQRYAASISRIVGGKIGGFTAIIGGLILVAATTKMYYSAISRAIEEPFLTILLTELLSPFGLRIIIIALIIALSGGAIENYLERNVGFLDRLLSIIIAIVMYFPIREVIKSIVYPHETSMLNIVFYSSISIAVVFVSLVVLRILSSKFFRSVSSA